MISRLAPITHPSLPGIHLFPMGARPVRGEPQMILVQMDGGSQIPLHTHTVSARMMIVAGSAIVRSSDLNIDGIKVDAGSVVDFHASIAHGFDADDEGMTFISENGGILGEGDWDIAFD